MKIIVLVLFSFCSLFLGGCENPSQSLVLDPIETQNPTDPQITSEKVKGALEGDRCGGGENIKCQAPLFCKKENNGAYEEGVCINPVEDPSMECPSAQAPVCGLKDNLKNAYLNECEAQRHNVEILYPGFCKKDESVPGNCDALITPIGLCDTIFQGFEFDGTKCVSKEIRGCEADIPFMSLDSCQKACLPSS